MVGKPHNRKRRGFEAQNPGPGPEGTVSSCTLQGEELPEKLTAGNRPMDTQESKRETAKGEIKLVVGY